MKNILLTISLVFTLYSLTAQNIHLFTDGGEPQIQFGIAEITKELSARSLLYAISPLDQFQARRTATTIVLGSRATMDQNRLLKKLKTASPDLQAEGFSLQILDAKPGRVLLVLGADAAGVMYGALELAEQIRVYGLEELKPTDQNPYMAMRGTKFNIPLDVRTPSYTDMSDAAQHNIAEMWSWEFWTGYIDNLARHRYNFISLWNLHPFPSMVKLDDYPDIALDDVMRSKGPFKENYTLQARDLDAPEIMRELEVVKTLSIDGKIDFWRRVMRYGKERNIDFYFITWNIFTYGTRGQYGITDDIHNPVTIDYFRKSVQAMIETYPDLKGIGLTTGENMGEANFAAKENWAYNTYAQGVLDAVDKGKDRKITFVHRQHQAGALDIADKFKPLIDHPNIDFIFSFKYAQAHVYSATSQPFHKGFVKDIQGRGNLKTIWTLRNDDVYYFRWGAPDFVREFIKNIPYEVSQGFYLGSDQYVWGREFLSRFPESPRQLEVEKHWYHWLIWGRLGYNPDLSNDRFAAILQARFPEVSGSALFQAWQNASMIYPTTTGFHWGALDFHWYIEGCQSRAFPNTNPYKFNNINAFIDLKPHPLAGNISIPDYVQAVVKDQTQAGTTPPQVAENLQQYADKALTALAEMEAGSNRELFKTLMDIRTIAYLGKYYGYKIQAATDVSLFRETGVASYRSQAIQALQAAAKYWKLYASEGLLMYHNPLWTNRVGYVDWQQNYEYALQDLDLIGAGQKLPEPVGELSGLVLEAEAATLEGGRIENEWPGFKGEGYVRGAEAFAWRVDIPKDGLYRIQYRYARNGGGNIEIPVKIDGQVLDQLPFWYTGANLNWAIDQYVLKLAKGSHQLQIGQMGTVLLDQLSLSPFAMPE